MSPTSGFLLPRSPSKYLADLTHRDPQATTQLRPRGARPPNREQQLVILTATDRQFDRVDSQTTTSGIEALRPGHGFPVDFGRATGARQDVIEIGEQAI
jgi:hypothetical protein